jgi:hypothetical protein
MKKIKLSKGKYAIVDDEDYNYLSRFNWFVSDDGRGHFHICKSINFLKGDLKKKYEIKMTDFIINRPSGAVHILHKNKNNFDCRKENLIFGNWSHTRHNQINFNKPNKTSIYRGVAKRMGLKSKKWRTQIQKNGVKYCFYYKTEKEAGLAYNKLAKKLYGEFAYQNNIK